MHNQLRDNAKLFSKNGYTNIHSHQQCMCVLVDPSFPPQHLYSDLIFASLIVGLIYISLIANEVEHLFMYLLAMWVFSKVKVLLSVSCPFFY